MFAPFVSWDTHPNSISSLHIVLLLLLLYLQLERSAAKFAPLCEVPYPIRAPEKETRNNKQYSFAASSPLQSISLRGCVEDVGCSASCTPDDSIDSHHPTASSRVAVEPSVRIVSLFSQPRRLSCPPAQRARVTFILGTTLATAEWQRNSTT